MRRLVLGVAALALSAGVGRAADVTVVAVSGPLASLASALAGDGADVIYPVPEGADPMLWRPSIAEIGEMQAADVILLNGAGFARWTAKTSLPRARVVDTSDGFSDAFISTAQAVTHSHGAEGEHSHTGTAPLVWMDFAQAEMQMQAVAARLARTLPQMKAEIATRAEELSGALLELDARAEALGAALAGQTVIADHPGLDYFARAYGLSVVALDWPPGEAPSAERIATFEAAVAADAPALFLWQSPPHPEASAVVGRAGLAQAVLDPHSDDPTGFIEAMSANLDALEAAISAL